jgi:hypothetical protein
MRQTEVARDTLALTRRYIIKQKYTYKAIRNMGLPVLAIGYCDLQTLFPETDAFGYSSGTNGWNCNYHRTYGGSRAIVSTGYRPIGTTVPRDIVKKYEAKARELPTSLSFDRIEKLCELQKDFIVEALAV